jgi:CRP-like cAMP-binding protein
VRGEIRKVNQIRKIGIANADNKTDKGTGKKIVLSRHALIQKHVQLIEIIEKIPLFSGLNTQQIKKVISICTKRELHKGEIVCTSGEESHEMFIILRGTLNITFDDGKVLSQVNPVGIVGEMGVFTGEKRSANIIAELDSVLLAIQKALLVKLFRQDSDLGIKVLTNVIQDLSKKLKRDNKIIHALKEANPAGASIDITPSPENDNK